MSSKQGWAACNQIAAIHSLTATFFRVWAELIRPHQTWPIRLSSCYHPLQGLIWGHPALQLAWGKGAKGTGLWVSSALQGCLFPCPVQHHGQSPVPRLVKDRGTWTQNQVSEGRDAEAPFFTSYNQASYQCWLRLQIRVRPACRQHEHSQLGTMLVHPQPRVSFV